MFAWTFKELWGDLPDICEHKIVLGEGVTLLDKDNIVWIKILPIGWGGDI